MTPPRSMSPAIWPNGASSPAAAPPAQTARCNRISCPSRWPQKRSCRKTARHPSRRRRLADADLAAVVAGRVEERAADKAVERAPAAMRRRPHPRQPILNMARNGPPAAVAEAAVDAAELPLRLSTFRPIWFLPATATSSTRPKSILTKDWTSRARSSWWPEFLRSWRPNRAAADADAVAEADLHGHIHARALIDLERKARLHGGLEPLGLDFQ